MQTQFRELDSLTEKPGRKFSRAECRLTGEQVCLETIDREWLKQNPYYSARKGKAVMAARNISHEGFLRVVASKYDEKNLYLATEWAEGNTLRCLFQKKVYIPEYLILSFLMQLVKALKASSQANITLGCLEAKNVFIKNSKLKINLPTNCVFNNDLQNQTLHCNGCSFYIAPEVLTEENYSPKSDVWSLGVLIFEMMFGTLPFLETSLAKLKAHLNSFALKLDEYSGSPSKCFLHKLLNGMLIVDPVKRLSINDLVNKLDEMKSLTSSHSLLGLNIEIDAIEYYCDPTITKVETLRSKQKLQRLQALVDQAHQVNKRSAPDEGQALKWQRFEFKWMLHFLQFTSTAFKSYGRSAEKPLLACLADAALDSLLEYERSLAKLSGLLASYHSLQAHLADEKSALLNICSACKSNSEIIPLEDGLQRLLEIIVEEVISSEEKEAVLRIAGIHANLVLDSMEVQTTLKTYFRLDRRFSKQAYFSELEQLDFETLIELMNSKVEYQNQHAAE